MRRSGRSVARALVGVLAIALAATSCDRLAPTPRPTIILIVIDTLRADRLGVYGNPDGLTPNLDALAAEGTLFEHAIAAAPWTQPSMASLFAAVQPSVHQVLDYDYAVRTIRGQVPKGVVFDDDLITLAEMLRADGYDTAAFVANPLLAPEYGFAQGFDHYDSSFADNTAAGTKVNQAAMRWLDARSSRRPLFLYLHYMDVHGPYRASPELLDPLLDRVEASPAKRVMTAKQTRDLGYLKSWPPEMSDKERHVRLAHFVEYWKARYDGAVREADARVRDLRRELSERGLWQGAYVILTADHGEALQEHRHWNHGSSLHEPELHVPLILCWPGRIPAGRRVAADVGLIDVAPTLAEQLGLRDEASQGASMVPLLWSRFGWSEPPVLAEGVKGRADRAVYAGGWKLIVSSLGRRRLYDLAHDRLEQRDVASAEGPRVARLSATLERQMERDRAAAGSRQPKSIELSPEQHERLRALGYER